MEQKSSLLILSVGYLIWPWLLPHITHFLKVWLLPLYISPVMLHCNILCHSLNGIEIWTLNQMVWFLTTQATSNIHNITKKLKELWRKNPYFVCYQQNKWCGCCIGFFLLGLLIVTPWQGVTHCHFQIKAYFSHTVIFIVIMYSSYLLYWEN